MTHSLLRPDRRPAGEGHSASADPSAGLLFPRPAESCGFDGKPGIPSDDAEGAKMESGFSRNPGRAPEGDFHFLQSSQAVTNLQHWSDCAVHNEPAYPAGPCDCGGFHSVLPDVLPRDGTDRALPTSLSEAPTLSDEWLSAWRENQHGPGDWPFTVNPEGDIVSLITGEIDPVLTAQYSMGVS